MDHNHSFTVPNTDGKLSCECGQVQEATENQEVLPTLETTPEVVDTSFPVDQHQHQFSDETRSICALCGHKKDPEEDKTEETQEENVTENQPEEVQSPSEEVNVNSPEEPSQDKVEEVITKAPVEEVKVEEKVEEPTEIKNPVGRPTDYKPEYCEQLVEHMAKGLTFESFAGVIDTHRGTLYDWKNAHPEFADAHKKAIEKSMLFWDNLGVLGVVGKVEGFNTAAWIFNMKNRHKWTDRQEVTGDAQAPLNAVIEVVRQKQESPTE